MKSRERFLFSIVLLLVNVTGAAGALLDCLGAAFEKTLLPAPFLWGMLALCLLSAVFWSKGSRMRTAVQWLLLFLVCFLGILLYWRRLAEGLGLVLQELFEQMNVRYGIRLIWNFSQEGDGILRQATWSVLVFMLFYVLLIGYAVVRERVLALVLADSVWFMTACAMDEFPAYIWLVLCILGLAAVLIRRAFRDDEKAGVQAVLIGTAVLGAVMAPLYRYGVPFLDSRYEALLEVRVELSRKINEEWLPRMQRMFVWLDFGEGTDVSGSLTRDTGTIYSREEIYRVTYSDAPKSTIYLRGFVGKDYAGDEWQAAGDSDLEAYYREKGLELPERKEELINLTYEVFHGDKFVSVLVEELAAPGGYTVYPYGARISEDYKSHWDGTVERKKGRYELLCSMPENYLSGQALSGDLTETEAGYRAYVYDTFCEYPADRFPELTAFLEQAEFRRDSVYHSLEDVMTYLKKNEVYDLGVPNTPEGKDFVEYFLFQSGRGYCAHFASSAVLMLRYLGVPARYVTGYAAAPESFQYHEDGTYSTVILDRQAHAWAEVYLDGIGWVPVEMTPGAVPFPGDNRQAQLELVGQLAGVPEEESPQYRPESFPTETPKAPAEGKHEAADRPENSDNSEGDQREEFQPEGSEEHEDFETGKPEGSEEREDSEADRPEGSESREDFETGKPEESEGLEDSEAGGSEGSAGREDSEAGGSEGSAGREDSEAGGSEGSAGREDSGAGGSEGSGGKEDSEAGKPEGSGGTEDSGTGRLEDAAGLILKIILPAAAVLLFLLMKKLMRCSSLGKLRQAENREKVFLLYGNTKRLMRAVGCMEKLRSGEEEGQDIEGLIEKCSFGRQEPTEEELQRVWNFCRTLERRVYGELPFYKKLLFLTLDRFGLRQDRAADGKRSRKGDARQIKEAGAGKEKPDR